MPTPPVVAPTTRRRILGLLALLAWFGAAWAYWQTQALRPRQTLRLDLPHYTFLTVPAGSPPALINPGKDELDFLDAASGRKTVIVKGDVQEIYHVVAARNHKTLALFKNDGTVTAWHTTAGDKPSTFPLPGCVHVVFSPDGALVAGQGPKENRVRLWDTASQKQVAVFDGRISGAGDGFFPDGRTLATVTAEGLKLWDLATRQPRLTLGHQVRLYTIAPNGRSLLTCDAQDRVIVWDCATGQEQTRYRAPENAQRMFLSPDGSKVGFSVSYPNSAWYDGLTGWFSSRRGFEVSAPSEVTTVLDAATGHRYAQVPNVDSNALFADDNTLATLSKAENAIQLWDLPPRSAIPPLLAWACLGLAVLLTAAWWTARYSTPRATATAK